MEPQITLVGNLTADPVRRLTAGGAAVTRIRVACSGRRIDKQTGEWTSTDPVYLSVSCWRQLADNAYQTLHKGDTVVVHGRLLMQEYVDAAGVKKQSYEVDAQSIAPDLTRYVAQLGRPVRDLPTADAAEPVTEPVPAAANPWGESTPELVEPAA